MRRFAVFLVVFALMIGLTGERGSLGSYGKHVEASGGSGIWHLHTTCLVWCMSWAHWHPEVSEEEKEKKRKECEKECERLYHLLNESCRRLKNARQREACFSRAVREYGECKRECLKCLEEG